jgi:enoyl-[acyl-carrier protein] reductase I
MLDGKTGIVFGVANKRSIAWAIAQALAGAGMRLAFTYQGERLKENVEELAATLPGSRLYPCDVGADAEIAAVFAGVERDLGRLDTLVHSVAFARKEDLEGEFLATGREGFRVAHDVSAYSLVALAREAAPLMERGGGGSVIAMTYYGAEKVAAGYNVMGVAKASLEAAVRYLAADLGPRGIRVNAISAGPIKTLAASGVHGLSKMLEYHRTHAPLRKNTEQEEVGDAALFLVSRMSRGITGEVLHVDGGYHVMGMAADLV